MTHPILCPWCYSHKLTRWDKSKPATDGISQYQCGSLLTPKERVQSFACGLKCAAVWWSMIGESGMQPIGTQQINE